MRCKTDSCVNVYKIALIKTALKYLKQEMFYWGSEFGLA